MPRSLSDPLPLRSSAVWPLFAKPEPLPVVYGRCTVPAIQFDSTRKFWLVADHAIGGVDAVRIDGRAEPVFAWRNGVDVTGHSVALVELGQALASTATLTAVVRGKTHPDTGALLENPADILQDLLSLAGHVVSDADLAEFRAACADVIMAGRLAPELSARAQIAELADSVGMLWSLAMPGLARRWPVEERAAGEPIYAVFAADEIENPRADCNQSALYTRLIVEFDWDWDKNSARRAVTLQADTLALYGDRSTTLQAKWISSAALAIELGAAWLQARARPRWLIEFEADLDPPVVPGGWFAVSHPLLPGAGDLLAIDVQRDWSRQRQRIAAERAAGPVPTISVGAAGGLFAELTSTLRVTYADGIAALVVADADGAPIRDAVVTFDDQTAKTDRTGTVRFKTQRGTHHVRIEAAGYDAVEEDIPV